MQQIPDVATDLTVAVLHYQTPDVLGECVRRVQAAAPGARLVVVDAGDSQPLPADWPRSAPNLEGVDVEVVPTANHSYAHAVNVALRLADTPFVAFLNADVFVEPETFANLLYALREPAVAAVGPLVRDGDGRLQDQGLPYRRHQRRLVRGSFAVDVPWLSGCLQVVRTAAVRGFADEDFEARGRASVGGMDETFRFYNEDIDWGARMRAAGWACRLVATPVVHLGGNATPPDDPAFLLEGLRGGYVISRRYQPAWYRRAHKGTVMLWAAVMERTGSADTRGAYRQVRAMFAHDRFADSPFGATLAQRNPRFGGRRAPGAERAEASRVEPG